MYIVDYDIPKEPAGKRVQFYRDLKKVNGNQCNFSTMSVIYTEEKGISRSCLLVGGCLWESSEYVQRGEGFSSDVKKGLVHQFQVVQNGTVMEFPLKMPHIF